MHHFVIIGLGRLGIAMIATLDSLGHEVLGIDKDEELVQNLSEKFPHTHLIAADATDESILRDLNVSHFDGAAVVIGENNLEASILATANLKELGGAVRRGAGAGQAPRPGPRESRRRPDHRAREGNGAQLARTMASPTVLDYVDLGEDEALAEANVPRKWVGKSLADLHLYRKSRLTVLALKRKGSGGTIPSGDTVLQEGDVLVIGGTKKNLDTFLADPDIHRA